MPINKPLPGEIIDRMGILTLKKKAVEASGGSLLAIRAELDWCSDALVDLVDGHKPNEAVLGQLSRQLDQLNRQVWFDVDTVHQLPDSDIAPLAKLAKRIAGLNDYRNKVVREINSLFGLDGSSEQKHYTQRKPTERSKERGKVGGD